MKKLSELLTVVADNDDFVLLQVQGTNSWDTGCTLQMNGFDGRESFIRVSNFNPDMAIVTFWYSGRTPENTLTFLFKKDEPVRDETDFAFEKLKTALVELGVSLG